MAKEQQHTPEEVADLVLNAAYERLKTDPGSIPAHALGQMLTAANRMAERRAGEDGDGGLKVELSVFEHLGSLPRERAIELLEREEERLSELLETYRVRRAALEGGSDDVAVEPQGDA